MLTKLTLTTNCAVSYLLGAAHFPYPAILRPTTFPTCQEVLHGLQEHAEQYWYPSYFRFTFGMIMSSPTEATTPVKLSSLPEKDQLSEVRDVLLL